ncbi:MAG: transcriptional regulator [Gammaproteobacteria bacterium]|jgi:predicted Zn-ribbon and HTH transcriptional regulator
MFRKDLIDLLLDHPMGLKEIAQLLEMRVKDVEGDLEHLRKSLKHSEYVFEVAPARCRKCEFQFHHDKLHKPSKCPVCHGTWIDEPKISVVQK